MPLDTVTEVGGSPDGTACTQWTPQWEQRGWRGERGGLGRSPLVSLTLPHFLASLALMQYSSPDHKWPKDNPLFAPASSAATDERPNCLFPLKPYAKGSKHEGVGHWGFYYRCARRFVPITIEPHGRHQCARVAWRENVGSVAGASVQGRAQPASASRCVSWAVRGGCCNLDLGMQLV